MDWACSFHRLPCNACAVRPSREVGHWACLALEADEIRFVWQQYLRQTPVHAVGGMAEIIFRRETKTQSNATCWSPESDDVHDSITCCFQKSA